MPVTELFRPTETSHDVIQRRPRTREVFDAAGIQPSSYDCALGTAALRSGIDLSNLLAALDQAASQP